MVTQGSGRALGMGTGVKAVVVRDVLGMVMHYEGVMCSDGARRTCYLVIDHNDKEVTRSVLEAAEPLLGKIKATATVYTHVYDQVEQEYAEIFGVLVWNKKTDNADALFSRFGPQISHEIDNPDLLPHQFVWGAGLDFKGPFPRGYQPDGWVGTTCDATSWTGN